MTTENERQKKLPYEKPKLRAVDLAAEEVLGIGCKTVTKSAPSGSPPCTIGNCSTIGS